MTKRITKKLPVVYGIVRSKEPKDIEKTLLPVDPQICFLLFLSLYL